MENTLIERAQTYLTPEVIERSSALVGESAPRTHKAFTAAITALSAGVAAEGSAPPGAARLLRILDEAGLRSPMVSIAERLAPDSGEDLMQRGQALLARVFGARVGAITTTMATAADMKPAAMSGVLGLAAPLVLGVLGSEAHARNLNAGGLASLLAGQKDMLRKAIPAGVANALGFAAPAPLDLPPEARPPSEASRKFWPLLFIVPALALGALLLRNRDTSTAVNEPIVEPAPIVTPLPRLGAGLGEQPPVIEPPAAPAPAVDMPTLPGGAAVNELALFLAAPGDPSRRFVFEEFTFAPDSARLGPGAEATLDSPATILAAHPEVAILVEGHTDSTGVTAGNQRLSVDRAEAVKAGLLERGITAERIATAGHSEDRPVAGNDTEEGRARNRRIEVVVTRR